MIQCNAEIEECKSTTAHHKGIIWNVRKVDQYSGYFSHPEIFGSARVGVISATIHTYFGFMICTTFILVQSEIFQRSGLRGTVMGSSKGRAEGWNGWAAYQGLGGWPCQLKYRITIYFPSPTLSNFEHNTIGCVECSWDKNATSKRLDIHSLVSYVKSKNHDVLLNPDEYVNSHTSNLRILCGTCNKVFTTSYDALRSSSGKCRSCSSHEKCKMNIRGNWIFYKTAISGLFCNYFAPFKPKSKQRLHFITPNSNQPKS